MTDDPVRKDSAGFRLLQKIPKIPRISWRDLAATLGPVLIVSVVAIVAAMHFVRPAPPRTLTIASGPEGSTFRAVAERYRASLARNGVTLVVRVTQGSQENLRLLTDPDSGVDIGLVQAGVTAEGNTGDLVSLGSMFYEPLTVFYRASKPIERLAALKGRRIAIGRLGSGTRFVAVALLKANEVDEHDAQLLDLEGDVAIDSLRDGQVDAIFLAGDSAAPGSVRGLLHAKGVRMFDFVQADAYVRRFRYLTKLELPPGAFDLGDNLPPQPFTMLAPTVELVARSDLHPALSDMLIEAAKEVHGRATLLQDAGTFPAAVAHDFPLSDDARRYYKSGKSISYRYLPFWLASLVDRAVVVLVPIIVVLVPGLRVVPALYGWRINSRIYRRYGDLMALERASLEPMTDEERTALLERLREIEKAVISLRMPGAYANQIYILREHIQLVRDHLEGRHLHVHSPSHSMDLAQPG